MSHPLPPKKEVALALLERSKVHIHLDPRREGVTVPPQFRTQPQLMLQIGLNMPIPIPDLRLDDEGMSCTLSFSRHPFYCVLPWSSVFAMVGDDGRGMVWPDDIPPDLQRSPPLAEVKPEAAPARRLAEVPAPAPAAASAEKSVEKSVEKEEKDEKKPRKGSRKKPRVAAVESEPERPVLVALPPPPAPAEKRGPRPVPSEKKRPPSPPKPSGGKAKRELPPYLRVVK
jgi:stringent starvation protein B